MRIHYTAMTPSLALEAAAQRRMRAMEAAYPAVEEWHLRLASLQQVGNEGAQFAARVATRLVGGHRPHGQARASDPAAALRFAFNALEGDLEVEREGARARAARWLQAWRGRFGQLHGHG